MALALAQPEAELAVADELLTRAAHAAEDPGSVVARAYGESADDWALRAALSVLLDHTPGGAPCPRQPRR